MKLIQSAQVGTFESSDIMILIDPADMGTGRDIELDSNVILQYGDDILQSIHKILDKYEIADVKMVATDKGALNHTIEARVEAALLRAMNIQKGTLL
ncbi:MAG: citrate lyase acyl carrier protein [Salinivirgaceae bacterium]|nr:citrate lyase acyl carrier protein [Salinivirgaceae bacterium]